MDDLDKMHQKMLHQLYTDSQNIPDFVIGRFSEHKRCYDLANYIFKIIRPLFRKHIFKKNTIDDIFIEMCNAYEDMIDTEPKLALEYFDYFKELLNYYRMESLDYELYEVAENLTNFLTKYKKIKLEYD